MRAPRPFFQLGEIEYSLRECVKKKGITLDEIKQATNKGIKSVDSMTFGNYYYLLANTDIWQKMGWEISQDSLLDVTPGSGMRHLTRRAIASPEVRLRQRFGPEYRSGGAGGINRARSGLRLLSHDCARGHRPPPLLPPEAATTTPSRMPPRGPA
jgi:hypothetical protein